MYAKLPKTDELRIVGKQLIRSATSVAANYRAACRARSKAEFAAKMSIVVEEADETLFWMEILKEAGLVPVEKLVGLKKEATEILYAVSTARKNAL
jgi:four helix bundle protein